MKRTAGFLLQRESGRGWPCPPSSSRQRLLPPPLKFWPKTTEKYFISITTVLHNNLFSSPLLPPPPKIPGRELDRKVFTSIFDKVPRTFTWFVYWRHGVTCDCKWLTMTLQVVSLFKRSSRKQHGTQNNRSWLSTCSQVIRPWLLKIQHGKPCHTFAKLDVSLRLSW